MKELFIFYLILIANLNFAFCKKVEVNDLKCEAQLEHFTASLSKRESWALDCKSGKLSWIKIQFSFSFSPQCLTRGRNFNLEFRTVTVLISVILSNAWISSTFQVTRESDWFKDNTVWFIIVQHRMHRQCRINLSEFLIGAKCEWSEIDAFWRCRDLIKIHSQFSFLCHHQQRFSFERKSAATRWRYLFASVMFIRENSIICQHFPENCWLKDHKWLQSIRLVFDKWTPNLWIHRHRLRVSFVSTELCN